MIASSQHGAAVLIALLPILPLAMYLRRRDGASRPRNAAVIALASLAILTLGLGVAIANGAF